jgi:lipopolysaccharide transport system permease protein
VAAPPTSPDVRIFVPTKRRVPLRELWTSRHVARLIGARDIVVKYKQSALGPLWLLFQPLGTLAAVTLAFSAVVGVSTGQVPYVLFALVGLTVWQFVQQAMSASTESLIRNAVLVRRSACPRTALMNAQLASNVPPFIVLLTVTIIATLVSQGFSLRMLLLPLAIVWLALLAWGLVMIVGSMSARFRDTVSAIPLIAQIGIFISPIGYPVDSAHGVASVVLALNPVTGLIEAWRWCLLDSDPAGYLLATSLVLTTLIAVGGWRLFTRMEVRFADYV